MTFQEFTNKFLEWTEQKIEAKKPDGFPVCPYARRARLTNKIQFIDSRTSPRDSFEEFNKEKFEIGICYLGETIDLAAIELILLELNEKYPDLLYFTSTPDSGYFEKNFTNCVFIQLAGDILEKRDQLHSIGYYKSWPEFYYKLIVGN